MRGEREGKGRRIRLLLGVRLLSERLFSPPRCMGASMNYADGEGEGCRLRLSGSLCHVLLGDVLVAF